ncbi:MAG TPA: ABC transporter ATP-binding protein [Opitutaceae bacterium]|jgi:lipopolysaccharide transport system ATP-binding protein|nr:ABC transporter ATP-binding protein [Opitutaceae bacterium]
MSNTVITVENLGKHYTLQHQARSGLLRDQLAELLRNPFRRGKTANATAEEFWALQEVNFTVNQGEVLGIIGRNGAGKSTLLKILSRITEPTTGRVTLRGRVASLLEVGTGFHPELTGRENIFLNGAILGMTRAEIRRKFDEIVAFAEVEQFLDTPVKHYSSGMYVRLAFAVAAHLEPEILIVDEVLAVGDAAFQKKCLGKMREVAAGHGRTVLFVSHNSAALLDICQTGLWLDGGRVTATGSIRDVISRYLQTSAVSRKNFAVANNHPSIEFVELDTSALQKGNLAFHVGFRGPTPLSHPVVGIVIYNKLGQPVCGANTFMTGAEWQPPARAAGVISAHIETPPLRSDTYCVSVWLGDAQQGYDHKSDALVFDYIAQNSHPKSPPPEVNGPLDFPWRWEWKETR